MEIKDLREAEEWFEKIRDKLETLEEKLASFSEASTRHFGAFSSSTKLALQDLEKFSEGVDYNFARMFKQLEKFGRGDEIRDFQERLKDIQKEYEAIERRAAFLPSTQVFEYRRQAEEKLSEEVKKIHSEMSEYIKELEEEKRRKSEEGLSIEAQKLQSLRNLVKSATGEMGLEYTFYGESILGNLRKIYDAMSGHNKAILDIEMQRYKAAGEFASYSYLKRVEEIENEKRNFITARAAMLLMDENWNNTVVKNLTEREKIETALHKAEEEWRTRVGRKREEELEFERKRAEQLEGLPKFFQVAVKAGDDFIGMFKSLGTGIYETFTHLDKFAAALGPAVAGGLLLALKWLIDVFDDFRRASEAQTRVQVLLGQETDRNASLFGTFSASIMQGANIVRLISANLMDTRHSLLALSVGTSDFIRNLNELVQSVGIAAYTQDKQIRSHETAMEVMTRLAVQTSLLGRVFEGASKEGIGFATLMIEKFVGTAAGFISNLDNIALLYTQVFENARRSGLVFREFEPIISQNAATLSLYGINISAVTKVLGDLGETLYKTGAPIYHIQEAMSAFMRIITVDFNKILAETMLGLGMTFPQAYQTLAERIREGDVFRLRLEALRGLTRELGLVFGEGAVDFRTVMFMSQYWGISPFVALRYAEDLGKLIQTGSIQAEDLKNFSQAMQNYQDIGIKLMQDQKDMLAVIKDTLHAGFVALVSLISKLTFTSETETTLRSLEIDRAAAKEDFFAMYVGAFGRAKPATEVSVYSR
jgi:hypothetical protein